MGYKAIFGFKPQSKVCYRRAYIPGGKWFFAVNLLKRQLDFPAITLTLIAAKRADAEIEWVDNILTTESKTTAFDEHKGFIINKLSKDRERSVEEVVGCREVLSLIYLQGDNMFPLTETSVRGLHNAPLAYYPAAPNYAGGYKTANRVTSVNHATGGRAANSS